MRRHLRERGFGNKNIGSHQETGKQDDSHYHCKTPIQQPQCYYRMFTFCKIQS